MVRGISQLRKSWAGGDKPSRHPGYESAGQRNKSGAGEQTLPAMACTKPGTHTPRPSCPMGHSRANINSGGLPLPAGSWHAPVFRTPSHKGVSDRDQHPLGASASPWAQPTWHPKVPSGCSHWSLPINSPPRRNNKINAKQTMAMVS